MGLDMYLYKQKKSRIFSRETITKMADDLYGNKILQDKTSDLYKALKDLTYEETRFDFIGKEIYLNSEVAYWRKANAIHNYIYTHFAEEEQNDYDTIYLTKEDLMCLVIDCKKVLNGLTDDKIIKNETHTDGCSGITHKEIVYNSELAKELIPTQSGFFFGSTEYNNWYKQDLENTIEQVNKILETTDFENEEIYYVARY